MSQIDQVYYRFEGVRYASPVDEFGESMGPGRLSLQVHRYPVEKITPKGVRLSCGKLVLHHHRKKFACPTVEQAKQCFIARKLRQMRILNARLTEARELTELAKKHSCEIPEF